MVTISKDGVFFEFIEIDEEGNETVHKTDVLKTTLGIVSYLTMPVKVEEDVTVEDLMHILALNVESTDFVFDSSLGGHSFTKFYEEMQNEHEPDGILSWMEIAHESDIIADDNELFIVPRMRGVGEDRELFSVEFSPVSSYKTLPVKLNTNYIIRKMDSSEKENIILSCTKSFTVFELFHALLYEMSYYGNPLERKEVLDEVLESLGVDTSVAFKLKDRGDIEKLKIELQSLIDDENYEEAVKVRDKIKRLLDNNEEQSETPDI